MPESFLNTSSLHRGACCPILIAALAWKDSTPPHLTDEETEMQRDYEAYEEDSRRSGSLVGFCSPLKPGPPTHRVTDIQGLGCGSARTWVLIKLVSPILSFLTVAGG